MKIRTSSLDFVRQFFEQPDDVSYDHFVQFMTDRIWPFAFTDKKTGQSHMFCMRDGESFAGTYEFDNILHVSDAPDGTSGRRGQWAFLRLEEAYSLALSITGEEMTEGLGEEWQNSMMIRKFCYG